MFLSRLVFPLATPTAQRLLADPYALHQALMTAFPPRAGRVLFRIEPPSRAAADVCILIQSTNEPSWVPDRLPPGAAAGVKRFDPSFRAGQHLRFRLRANPTSRRKVPDRASGIRVGLVGEERLRTWLERKGLAAGFRPDGFVVIDEGQVAGHKPDGRPLAFQSVRFEGILTVADPERFSAALTSGIGSAKAFGFGLLSVARAGQ
jgi:CRISPR system Cascade subunit CasE